MSELKLTKTKLLAGVWEGVLTGHNGQATPELVLTHQDTVLEGLDIQNHDGDWYVRAPIPQDRISDGVHVFIIADSDGNKLADFSFIAGEALAEDIRAEMELLREELDMLKRVFRRHCLEVAELG